MLNVSGLCAEYPGDRGKAVKAAQDVSFEVPDGKLFTLLGPSGCGKTTTLRSIAGLERPTAGEIRAGNRVVYSSAKGVFVAPNERRFGMVFQSYAIWPHMNVFQNVAFPLEVGARRWSRKEVADKVERVLKAVALEELAEREATKLSGGQQQRLALARAIIMEPALLLLDEPLSNLDAKLRERMRFELKRLQRELGLTTVYVTHDQSEALALSHEIAVMDQGRIVQCGTPREIYDAPRNRFVADFVGTTNFLDGKAVSADRIETMVGTLKVSGNGVAKGSKAVISVRPEDVELYTRLPEGLCDANVARATVDSRAFLGEHVDVLLKVNDSVLHARTHPSLRADVGQEIYVVMRAEKCITIGN